MGAENEDDDDSSMHEINTMRVNRVKIFPIVNILHFKVTSEITVKKKPG